jgi:hypothetical protein
MKFGLILPNRGKPYGDVPLLLDLALLAEESDRDGWFIRDHIGGAATRPAATRGSVCWEGPPSRISRQTGLL